MEGYSRLLSSNVAPEPVEVTTIQEGIDARTKAIGQLDLEELWVDDELQGLETQRRGIQGEGWELEALLLEEELQRWETQRQQIQEERYNLSNERAALRSLLTPFGRLPAEILSEVFMVVHDKTDRFRRSSQVLALCEVSSQCRDIAFGTPRLWNRLSLDATALEGCSVEKISTWLGRSGSLPRTLQFSHLKHVCYYPHTPGSECNLVKTPELLRLLAKGPLVHELSLTRIHSDCLQDLARHMSEQPSDAVRPWGMLETLAVDVEPRPHRDWPALPHLLSHLPPVHCFNIRSWGQSAPQAPTTSNSMLGHLTTLAIEHVPISPILQLLLLCKNLQELTMAPNYSHNSSLNHAQAPLLPHLRVLRLRGFAYEIVSRLPQLLHTPALVELEVSFFDPSDDYYYGGAEEETYSEPEPLFDMVTGLTSFARQSEATVRRIVIRNLNISSPGLERMLLNLPLVTDLTLNRVRMGSTAFQASDRLMYSHCQTQFLPRLERLELSHMLNNFPFEDVCDFFAHRAAHPPQSEAFRSLVLGLDLADLRSYDTMPENELRNAVSKLRRLGVEVWVFSKLEL